MKTFLIISLSLLFNQFLNGQTIYGLYNESAPMEFGILNPVDASFDVISTLDDVETYYSGYSAFNWVDSILYFKGIDLSGDTRIYSLDVNTGEILFDPLITDTIAGAIAWSCHDDQLYGLKYSVIQPSLVAIDNETGDITEVMSYDQLSGFYEYTNVVDQVNNTIIVRGFDAGSDSIYTIDLSSGAIENVWPYTVDFGIDNTFLCSDGNLYGLGSDGTNFWFHTIDLATGEVTSINEMSSIDSYILGTCILLIDEGVFVLDVADDMGLESLTRIDITTGEILTSVPFNINNPRFVETFGCCQDPELGATHIDVMNNSRVFPNPVTENAFIKLNSEITGPVTVTNMAGESITLDIVQYADLIQLNTSAITPGIYFVKFMQDRKLITMSFIKL